jgi:DNA polymerase IV
MADKLVSLDLSTLPPVFVSASFFETEDLHEFEEELSHAGAALTYDIQEAEIIISKATRVKRITLDLRAKGLFTKEAPLVNKRTSDLKPKLEESGSAVEDSATESEGDGESASRKENTKAKPIQGDGSQLQPPSEERIVTVVSLKGFQDSKRLGLQPLDGYTTYRGQHVEGETAGTPTSMLAPDSTNTSRRTTPMKPNLAMGILERAKEDSPKSGSDRFGKRKFGLNTPSATPSGWEAGHGTKSQYAHLLQETTTEHDGGTSSDLPEMPAWVKEGIKYACQRCTPKTNPNDQFIALLKKIKHGRLLTNDEIGVRAYSTSIAALASYTYKISNPREILALPGCEVKIANLFIEWTNTGKIQAVEELEADQDLKILDLFYNIWGVGVTTARELYFDKGWREMDDIIEFAWPSLSRVQQIGVKFYDEFLDLIPRAEVENIAKVIHEHAVKARNCDIQSMVVGGYRRGKEACGDVDIILSHPDESQTLNLVEDIVASLEDENWITHTLTLSLNNSKRDQKTLPFRADGGGHGFDTLDKALVVWQNPVWPTKTQDLAADPSAKNPNIHRRVDIIISPWRTVGCSVLGWSGATTFERDLRRYAKNERGWKFDSSGVRHRGNGEVIDLEGYFEWKGLEGEAGRAKTMQEAERRVFEGMQLAYREPWDRCTG